MLWSDPAMVATAAAGVILPVTDDRDRADLLERLQAFQTRASRDISLASVRPARQGPRSGKWTLWIGEQRDHLRRRLGPPSSRQGAWVETRGGLVTWFDAASARLVQYRNEDTRFQTPQGVRPGLELKSILEAVPVADGVYVGSEPSQGDPGMLLVQSIEDGLRVELHLEGNRWVARVIWGDTHTGTARAESAWASQQPMRRLDARVISRILSGNPELPHR